MAISEKTTPYARLRARIRDLGVYGANAVHRRVLTLLSEQFEQEKETDVANTQVEISCRPDLPCRPDSSCGPDTCRSGRQLSFEEVMFEGQQDDRRRSIFIDPEESLTSNLIDFFTGRLDALEVRGTSQDLITRAEKRAIAYMKQTQPIVTISSISASDAEILDSLKSMVRILELRIAGERDFRSDAKSLAESSIFLLESCRLLRNEGGATRFLDNGQKMEQQFRDVFFCKPQDNCCDNQGYIKYGDWSWRTVWEDGNPNSAPPTNPPPFQQYPWDNRCPVLPGPGVNVTSDWGWRTINGQQQFHQGMDIGAGPGTAVSSVRGGRIVHINRTGANGETGVIARTTNSDEILQYWHIVPSSNLRVGDEIQVGTVMGAVSGSHPAPHLHLARYEPPGGDWTQKGPGNSRVPCP